MNLAVGFLLGTCIFMVAEALPASSGDESDNPSKLMAVLQPVVTQDVSEQLNASRGKREQERVIFSDNTYQPCRTGTCSGGAVPVRETTVPESSSAVRETSCPDGRCGTVRESSCPDGRCGTVRESSCPDGRCGAVAVRESSCPDGRCGTVRESSCPSGRCGSYVTTVRQTYQQPVVTYQQPITTYSCRGSGCGGGSYPVRESSCPSGRCGTYYTTTVRETYQQQPIVTYQQPITTYSCRGSGCGGGAYPIRESGCPSGRCGSYYSSYQQPITTYSCRGSGCAK